VVSSGRRVISAGSAGYVRSDRNTGTRAPFDRGTCPVCRRQNVPIRHVDGKVGIHGRTAASPQGCAGKGQPPYRERKQKPGELPVADIRPTAAHDQGPEPELPLDVLVERRDGEVPLHLRPPPAGGAA
jgi:hypothetical protein